MEPVTHFLTGACLGRTGFNRRTAYATLAMTLAAEAPDIDVLWSFRGPVANFQHHRGFTHTLLGVPLVALAVTAIVWLWHRSRKQQPTIPPRWALLWLLSLLASLSHIFLDWTNNYGVRPFAPFNPRWYALDIAFILEPVVFAALLLGLLLPAIFGLADREIGARKPLFRGRGWAIAAMFLVGIDLGVRAVEHHRQAGPYEGIVVHEQDADLVSRTGHVGHCAPSRRPKSCQEKSRKVLPRRGP